ncbi:MAG: hypothetical protein LUD18_03885 [Lachnospiraceae bacterium]|nr:hypothetical protein [Lachnospiraceae bacterium]
MVLKHKVRINVTDQVGEKQLVLEGGRFSLPGRLVRLLFGEGMKILVITPGSCVDHVVISEIGKGGDKVEAV